MKNLEIYLLPVTNNRFTEQLRHIYEHLQADQREMGKNVWFVSSGLFNLDTN